MLSRVSVSHAGLGHPWDTPGTLARGTLAGDLLVFGSALAGQ